MLIGASGTLKATTFQQRCFISGLPTPSVSFQECTDIGTAQGGFFALHSDVYVHMYNSTPRLIILIEFGFFFVNCSCDQSVVY